MPRRIIGYSVVTRRGQITIPKEIRDKMDIKEGDKVFFIEDNGRIVLVKGPIELPP